MTNHRARARARIHTPPLPPPAPISSDSPPSYESIPLKQALKSVGIIKPRLDGVAVEYAAFEGVDGPQRRELACELDEYWDARACCGVAMDEDAFDAAVLVGKGVLIRGAHESMVECGRLWCVEDGDIPFRRILRQFPA